MRTRTVAVATLLSLLGTANAQQMYRWVDKDGRVTYSQNPPVAGAAKNVQSKGAPSGPANSPPLPYSAQVAIKNFPVTLYLSHDCGNACDDGRELLKKRGIPYREVLVIKQSEIDAIKTLTGNTQVPVLRVGSQAVSGFNATSWKLALDDAGYPATLAAQSPANEGAGNSRPAIAVTLYTNSQCGETCQNARDLLGARKVAYKDVPVESAEALNELKKHSDSGSVPVLVVGTVVLRGFDTAKYQAALDLAGIPRVAQAKR